VPTGERIIGLLHLGPPRQEREPPERAPADDVVTYLD
jgi:nitroreductase